MSLELGAPGEHLGLRRDAAGGAGTTRPTTLAPALRRAHRAQRPADAAADPGSAAPHPRRGSRLDLQQEEIDLRTLVATAYDDLQARVEGRRLDLSLRLPPEPDPRRVRPKLVEQVVTHILANATKFTPTGLVMVSLKSNGAGSRIVGDTGIGSRRPTVIDFSPASSAATSRRSSRSTDRGWAGDRACRRRRRRWDGDGRERARPRLHLCRRTAQPTNLCLCAPGGGSVS